MTDKLSTLIANAARLLDGAMALPADADREQAALDLADALITESIVVLPGAVADVAEQISIAGFTLAYCDDRSAYLAADNRPGEEGVSVRIDHLSESLSHLYLTAQAAQPAYPEDDGPLTDEQVAAIRAASSATDKPAERFNESLLDELDIPEVDQAARVVDREVSFGDEAACEGCKI